MTGEPLPWSQAWGSAARAFWSNAEPGRHFRTSVGPALADRMAALVRETDARLGHPDELTVADIGCGDGELLELLRQRCTDLHPRVRWLGIDVRPVARHGIDTLALECPAEIAGAPLIGAVMAHEWLDEIPCDIVERDDDGIDRLVLVKPSGVEVLGPSIDDDDSCALLGVDAVVLRTWLERWWPLRDPGERAEIGAARDHAWRWLGELISAGTILATDYGHIRHERLERHRHGTLAAYRAGRIVRPSPDGTVNLTAHVAVDSCAEALPGTSLTRQREEIAASSLGDRPSAEDVEGYFAGLHLRESGAWGSVSWLRWDA